MYQATRLFFTKQRSSLDWNSRLSLSPLQSDRIWASNSVSTLQRNRIPLLTIRSVFTSNACYQEQEKGHPITLQPSKLSEPQFNPRVAKLLNKVPPFFRSYVSKFARAPAANTFSLLLLHEVTAVIPLFGLLYLFHYSDWTPPLSDELLEMGQSVFAKMVS